MNMKYLTEKYPGLTLQGEETTVNRYCLLDSHPWELFFSFYCILYGLYICEEEGLRPIINMGSDHLYYAAEKGDNIFGYFYDQERNISTAGFPKIILSGSAGFLAKRNISVSAKKLATELLKKYFVLNKEIKCATDDFCTLNFGGHRMLGVHYHGGYNMKEDEMLHFTAYLRKIDNLLENNICDKIFFVTDEPDLRDYMRSRYGNKVSMYSSEDNAGPGDSQYLLARNAIVECYLLADCNLLLSSRKTSMPMFATFINPAIIHLILEL